MNYYLGFVSRGNTWYRQKLIKANSKKEAFEKLKKHYEINFPEIAKKQDVHYNIDDIIE